MEFSWISKLLVVAICFTFVLSIDITKDTKGDIEEIESDRDAFLQARKAKSVLRVKRGWRVRFRSVKGLTGEEDKEEERAKRERNREAAHRAHLARTCPASCWSPWGGWQGCNAPCGNNGVQVSTRKVAPPSGCAAWIASHGCSGPSSRTQACNRFCHNGGTPQTSKCACKAGFKGTCCDQKVTCGFPGKPDHGTVTPGGSTHNYGTVASYKCDTGYSMSRSRKRDCLQTGQWGGSVPTCTLIKCNDPGTPSFGKRTGSDFTFGKTVVYTCNSGYKLSGSSSRTCQGGLARTGHWSGTAPTCNAVPCPKLSAPSGGTISVPASPIYGSVAQVSCSTGYYLQGSARRQCQANGQWSGSAPTCQRITCSALTAPTNGKVNTPTGQQVQHGTVAVYSCNAGYKLSGNSKRTCTGSGPRGTWTGSLPTCNAVSCGDPGTPTHGARSGSVFKYPQKTSFTCLPGYYIKGATSISCQSDGKWSASIPTCNACAKNFFKSGSNIATVCVPCPSNSHTLAAASGNVNQCVCNPGFKGPNGGPCVEILCSILSPPVKGSVVSCGNKVNSKCVFSCVDGYIFSSGDSTRTCKIDGQWSGKDPKCTACPVNTYQSNSGKCEKCPTHSHTQGSGSIKTGCVCDTGFKGALGGPCNDVDECKVGNGGCEQKCDNNVGSYKCVCNIPGFAVDPLNDQLCFAEKECDTFPKPDNGGAVCTLIPVTNTQRCQLKCNAGYDFLERPNVFEECGPNSNWHWSYQVASLDIPPCVAEFMPGVRTEADVFYYVDECSNLNAVQKRAIRIAFIDMLKSRGICSQGKDCSIDNVRIDCGTVDDFGFGNFGGRKKRATVSVNGKKLIRVKFNIEKPVVSVKSIGCGSTCGTGIDYNATCEADCKQKYQKETQIEVNSATTKLQAVFQNNVKIVGGHSSKGVSAPDNMVISVSGMKLHPATPEVPVKNVTAQCTPGTVRKNQTCVECPAGTYQFEVKCRPCSKGFHQPRQGQTRCWKCPPRSYSYTEGAKACSIIPHDGTS